MPVPGIQSFLHTEGDPLRHMLTSPPLLVTSPISMAWPASGKVTSLPASFGGGQFRYEAQRNREAFQLVMRAHVEPGGVVTGIARDFHHLHLGFDQFLHPLVGGPGRDGWPAGRDVYRSEILQVISQSPTEVQPVPGTPYSKIVVNAFAL